MRKTIAAVLVAALLWFVMFSPGRPHINFWYTMTCSALTLTTLSTVWCREWLKDLRFSPRAVAAGLSIAFVLWWVFWTGDKVSQWMFGFARGQVDMIYSMKGGTLPAVIAVLLLLVIGPAEEIFWRGFIQRRMMARWGANAGLVAATACYTLVHLPSLNFMLIVAAGVVGGCWASSIASSRKASRLSSSPMPYGTPAPSFSSPSDRMQKGERPTVLPLIFSCEKRIDSYALTASLRSAPALNFTTLRAGMTILDARGGVDTLTLGTLVDLEGTEADQLHFLASYQSILQFAQRGVQSILGLSLLQTRAGRNLLD